MSAEKRGWCGLPRQRVSAPGQYRAGVSMMDAPRSVRGVLRGLSGMHGNVPVPFFPCRS
jgi:hypothetical protein